jgi:uncharacterized membrane protein YdbT with pleckstrin-like domain
MPVLLVIFALTVANAPFLFIINAADNAMTQIVRQFHQPPPAQHFNLMWLIILLPEFLFAVALLLGTWFSYSNSDVTLTNRRLVFRTGFFSRHSGDLPLENIESIFISEPLIGRMCGYGSVTVTTVGGARFPLCYIGEPQDFHFTLQHAVATAKGSRLQIPKPSAFPPGSAPQSPSGGDDDSRYKPKA